MAWVFNNPLVTLTDSAQNKEAEKVWEGESLGGITEDNNRLPKPVVGLLMLTIITAFLVTAPLWGQRPTAALYEEYIGLMDSPQVMAEKDDAKAMNIMFNSIKAKGSPHVSELIRHPITMNDLRVMRPQIEELKRKNLHLDEYTVVGSKIVLANFEGNKRADGSTIRKQPWWDRGYTIDIFYILYFCVAVIIVVKRLPPVSFKPSHDTH